MLALAAESFCAGMGAKGLLPEEVLHWQRLRLIAAAFLPGIWLCFSLSYARGNAGDFLRKWRYLLGLVTLVSVGGALLFRESLIGLRYSADGEQWSLGLGMPGLGLHLLLLFTAVLVLMNLERTYRTTVGTMQWRIKFMVLGLGVIFAARIYTTSQALLFRGLDPAWEVVNSGGLIIGGLLTMRTLVRAGHFAVDAYPSQNVLHSSFTILIVGIYLLIIGVFAKIVTFLGGDAAFAFKALLILVALVLLTLVLLSDRVRLLTRTFISRRFQRPLYDYRQVWRSFTENTARCVEQPELCRAVTRLVADTFHALSVTVWLVDRDRQSFTFGSSTSLAEAKAESLRPQGPAAAELIWALANQTEPVDLDSSTTEWAAVLRQCHPGDFLEGGHRVCVPLLGGDEVLGVMILGDRVGGVAFSLQDFDLLKCIAGHVAANLLRIQLSEKLLQAKELEAFQTMSAFFVHDLKNTASTLNLMLKNLPVHFGDPAFREDALRGIAKTVTHINDLIGRLSQLRQDLKLQPVESDLNELVTRVLSNWQSGAGTVLVKELQPLPRLWLDQEQIVRVVTNFVLNAFEACNNQGQVRVATGPADGGVVLTVMDTGCGMTAEFLNRGLFRPFQTTKARGLGIGMFQTKTIVHAHGGRIEVQSELGKGTTFRVFFPLPAPRR
jgi:putative PEP-CTERM system histidine kinase